MNRKKKEDKLDGCTYTVVWIWNVDFHNKWMERNT